MPDNQKALPKPLVATKWDAGKYSPASHFVFLIFLSGAGVVSDAYACTSACDSFRINTAAAKLPINITTSAAINTAAMPLS